MSQVNDHWNELGMFMYSSRNHLDGLWPQTILLSCMQTHCAMTTVQNRLGLHLYQLYFIYSLTECSSGLIVYPVLCTKYLVHAYLQLCVVLKFDIHDIWCCQITRDAIIAAAARLLLHFVTHQNSNAQWILVSECSASVVSSRVPFQLQAHLDRPAGYCVMTSGCARSEECCSPYHYLEIWGSDIYEVSDWRGLSTFMWMQRAWACFWIIISVVKNRQGSI